jgi:hypothetical protein
MCGLPGAVVPLGEDTGGRGSKSSIVEITKVIYIKIVLKFIMEHSAEAFAHNRSGDSIHSNDLLSLHIMISSRVET